MAADTLSLRERIDARLVAAGFNPTSRGEILTQVLPVVEQALAEKDAQIAALQAKYLAVIREVETPLPPDEADYE